MKWLKNKYKFSIHETIMIVVFLSIVWFGWGQFQFQPECSKEQCEIEQCGM